MCGIIGGVWSSEDEDFRSRLSDGLRHLQHRGPDDEGVKFFNTDTRVVALGHRRLSVIDLTDEAGQPMVSSNGRYSIVYNGELYNYQELRAELVRDHKISFKTNGDTEVFLEAWATWGEEMLPKTVGMFAAVIYDSIDDVLIAFRDAFGIKPFFYSLSSTSPSLVFSSELDSLLRFRNESNQLNWQRAYDYLIFGLQDEGSETFVEGINRLEPAHIMRVAVSSGELLSYRQWWNPSIEEKNELSLSEAAETLREKMLENVRLHLRSDVPVGISLSGGIDSSALVCLVRHLEPSLSINTFSFITDDRQFSEEKWIDIINDRVGARAHKVKIQSGDFMESVETAIRTQGEPFNSTSIFAQNRVFHCARENGIPVMLEGQGADELLGGYLGYPGQRMRSLLESRNLMDLIRFANGWKRSVGANRWPISSFFGQLLPEAVHQQCFQLFKTRGVRGVINESSNRMRELRKSTPSMGRTRGGRGRRVVETLRHSMLGHELPTLLRFADRNAMSVSVENRVPFLTTELAELALSLPEDFLISMEGQSKYVFRKAMKGLVPDSILDRKDKIGYVAPTRNWIGPLVQQKKAMLLDSAGSGFFNLEGVSQVLNKPEVMGLNGGTHEHWRLINLLLWMRTFEITAD